MLRYSLAPFPIVGETLGTTSAILLFSRFAILYHDCLLASALLSKLDSVNPLPSVGLHRE